MQATKLGVLWSSVNEMPNVVIRSRAMARRDDSLGRTQQDSRLRPQSVVFALLAEHVLDRDVGLFSGSFIEILRRQGIGEHATRSTLARMTRRDLLRSERHGRKTYFALTPQSFTDFDWLAVLDSTGYNRGGPSLQEWDSNPEQ